jgi:hypothetical protein
LQMGLFLLLVWVPIVAAGSMSAFQRMEVATNLALIAAGWVVADSFSVPRPPLRRWPPTTG